MVITVSFSPGWCVRCNLTYSSMWCMEWYLIKLKLEQRYYEGPPNPNIFKTLFRKHKHYWVTQFNNYLTCNTNIFSGLAWNAKCTWCDCGFCEGSLWWVCFMFNFLWNDQGHTMSVSMCMFFGEFRMPNFNRIYLEETWVHSRIW